MQAESYSGEDTPPGPGHELARWFQTPVGRYLLAWEQAQFDAAVADIFGFHALQLGLPELDALAANRMPHRWLALPESHAVPDRLNPVLGPHSPAPGAQRLALVTHSAALPFPANSLDLLALPHTLELSADPHTVLREAERVLVPEGRVVMCGLNPTSLWGMRQARAHAFERLGLEGSRLSRLYLPEAGAFIGYWRLRDWLRLLGFEVETARFGAYRPAVRSEAWLQRWAWMDRLGPRWWPIFGAVYFLVAVKRVRGMHLLGPAWKPRRAAAAAPVSVARRHSSTAHQKKTPT